MNNYLDFKKVSIYITHIKNIKWMFNFLKDKIIANTDNDYNIYESKSLIKEVSKYDTYNKCFMDLILEINNLELCIECNRLDDSYCRKCEIDKIIDSIPHNINEQCPVCYKDLTLRYAYICDDSRHKLCCYCYHNISLNLDVICPICRQNSSDSI
jgi:hypothetical protein